MMLSPDGLVLLNKNVFDATRFWEAYETGSLLGISLKR
jgi:hypothetical protein